MSAFLAAGPTAATRPALAIQTRMGVATCDLCKRSDFVNTWPTVCPPRERPEGMYRYHGTMACRITSIVTVHARLRGSTRTDSRVNRMVWVHVIKAGTPGEFRFAQQSVSIPVPPRRNTRTPVRPTYTPNLYFVGPWRAARTRPPPATRRYAHESRRRSRATGRARTHYTQAITNRLA